MAVNAGSHWENVYRTKALEAVSWYRPHLEISLDLIETAAGRSRSCPIVDVGGGESTLVDDLVGRGYQDVTVLDVSPTALEVTKRRLGPSAERVHWLVGDVTSVTFPSDRFEVWHDRAVFHFLTAADQRAAYVRGVLRAVRTGGHVIVSAFGPEGPARCSGLDVVRYSADALHGQFGARFNLIESVKELHQTPWGTAQQFVYCYCRMD